MVKCAKTSIMYICEESLARCDFFSSIQSVFECAHKIYHFYLTLLVFICVFPNGDANIRWCNVQCRKLYAEMERTTHTRTHTKQTLTTKIQPVINSNVSVKHSCLQCSKWKRRMAEKNENQHIINVFQS